jgi:putative transposase
MSKTLGRTHLMYAQYLHRLHSRLGHFWQSRYYSCPMDEAYTDHATAYVEVNPVRAGLVETPQEWPWSSAAAHLGAADDDSGLLDLPAWFAQHRPKAWAMTLRTFERQNEQERDRLRTHTRTGRPLGDASFLDQVESLLGRSVRARSRGRPKSSKNSQG